MELRPGEWHHLVVTWDSNDRYLKIYVNGTVQLSETVSQGMNIPGGGTLVLGQVGDKSSKFSHSSSHEPPFIVLSVVGYSMHAYWC